MVLFRQEGLIRGLCVVRKKGKPENALQAGILGMEPAPARDPRCKLQTQDEIQALPGILPCRTLQPPAAPRASPG